MVSVSGLLLNSWKRCFQVIYCKVTCGLTVGINSGCSSVWGHRSAETSLCLCVSQVTCRTGLPLGLLFFSAALDSWESPGKLYKRPTCPETAQECCPNRAIPHLTSYVTREIVSSY